MRRLLCLGLAFFTLFLSSCAKERYREDLSCEALGTALIREVSIDGGYAVYDGDYVERILSSPELYRDQRVLYSVRSENINEIGVFLANSEEDAASLLRVLQEFLQTTKEEQRAFIESYAPQEAAKLDFAEARRFGRYVIYTILEKEAGELVFDTAKTLLKE